MPITTTRYDNVHGVPLGVTIDGVSSALLPDPQGNIVGRIDASQTVVGKTWYWPYGERRTGNPGFSLGFGGAWGYYTDQATPGIYIRARYLKPNWTRWLTVDPLWPEELAHSYVADSPTTRQDPSGQDTGECKVSICSLYGFDTPGFGWIITHQYICVTGPNGGCSGGLYYTGNPFLGGGRIGDQGMSCSSRHEGGVRIECEVVAEGCQIAQLTCGCIKNSVKDPGFYCFVTRCCYAYPQEMLRCACSFIDWQSPKFKNSKIKALCKDLAAREG